MQPHIPAKLLGNSATLCKSSPGPTRVKLVLRNGRTIYDVFVGGAGEIAMAGGRLIFGERDLRFRPADIVEVLQY
jgi:hypothetical protein